MQSFPLAGLRAVELATGSAGPGAGMYLADYGMDVIKVELPEGDPARRDPPLIRGTGRSFLALNRGKRSVTLDWRRPEGRKLVDALLASADTAIVDQPAEAFSYERLSKLNPALVYAAVSSFGEAGPYAWLPGYDPLVQAVSGVMASARMRGGFPSHAGYRLSDGATPMLLCYGIMLALLARGRTGRGQRVDVSKLQAAIAMQSMQVIWAENDPVQPSDPFQPMAGCYQCADGRYIHISTLQRRQVEALYRVLDLEHLLADDTAVDQAARRAELHSLFEGIFSTRPSSDWLAALEEANIPCGPMLDRAELFDDPQVAANGFATRVDHPNGGAVRVLGTPIALSDTPARPGKSVPALGEHTNEVLQELAGRLPADLAPPPARTPAARRRALSVSAGPLTGIRVLDLAGMYAGPGAAMYLGDMGADVIKIEPPALDDSRRLQVTPFLNPNSRAFMVLNRSKRGMVLDLRTARGQEVLQRLVRDADVLIHNVRPGVQERLGLDYARLSASNPRLIYAWVSAFGSRGPFRMKPAYDNIVQGYSGIYAYRARRDGEPTGAGTFVADSSLPMLYGFAICAALWARERTGRGQALEGSLLGMALAMQAAEWVADTEEHDVNPALDPLERACLVLRCQDGDFVALAVITDEEWRRVCRALDRRDGNRFQTLPARLANRDALVALLAPVFQQRPAAYWTETLLQAGVPCVPVHPRNALPRDPHMQQNAIFTHVEHPAAGPTLMFSVPVQLSGTPGRISRPAPVPGEHTGQILAEAGYSSDEIAALRASAVVA